MRSLYYHRDGSPATSRDWASRFELEDRIVCQSHLPNGIFVSTVFLGLDHSFGDGPPLIFESMAFAAEEEEFLWPEDLSEGPDGLENAAWLNAKAKELNAKGPRKYHPDLDQMRYSTEAEAIAGHLGMCEKFFAGSRLLPLEVSREFKEALAPQSV